MDPFVAALDAQFHAPGSAAAVYISQHAAPRSVRVIERQRTGIEGTVRPRPVSLGKVFDIRISEVAEPLVGDVVALNGAMVVLTIPPQIDVEGLTWACDAPLLERTLDVLRPVRLPDAHGDPEDTFTVMMSIPAARLDQSGTEADQAPSDQKSAWLRATFFVPWSDEAAKITPAYQLREGDKTFDVQAVAEVGTRAAIEITGIARVA